MENLIGEGKDLGWFLEILVEFLKLGGIGFALSAIINAMKSMGIIKDGQSGLWLFFLQVIGLSAIGYMGFTQPELFPELLQVVDEDAVKVGTLIGLIMEVVISLVSSVVSHRGLLKGLPIIGKSFSEPVKK